MTQFRYLLLLLTGFWFLLSTTPVLAQDDEDPTVEMARQRFKEGIDFFDAKQFQKARAAFLQAYALKKHPAVLLNLAQSELRSGHEAEAADHFSEFLRTAKEAKPDERQAAQSGLFDAKKSVGEVAVRVDEKGAEVFVDGKPRGSSPLPGPVYVAPGTHTITSRKGDREATTRVTVGAGESASASLSLKASPGDPSSLGSGDAATERKRRSNSDEKTSLVEAEDSSEKVGVGEWFVGHPVAWLTVGLAVIGGASGLGFSLGAQSNYDSADATAKVIETEAQLDGEPREGICTRIGDIALRRGQARANDYQNACTIYQQNVNRGDAMKTAAIGGFVVGGAAAIGTVVYYFLDTGSSSSSSARQPGNAPQLAISPVVAPSFTGFNISGTF